MEGNGGSDGDVCRGFALRDMNFISVQLMVF